MTQWVCSLQNWDAFCLTYKRNTGQTGLDLYVSEVTLNHVIVDFSIKKP